MINNNQKSVPFGIGVSDAVKSPSQLMTHVDQMHKEELDQLLQKLQFENL